MRVLTFRSLLLAGAMSLAVAGPVASPAGAQQTLNVRDADIRAFIQDAARVTGRTFIIDARVQGKVSVVTDRPLSKSEYFEIFLSTLRANGLVAVPSPGGAFRIQPVEGIAGQPSSVGRAASRNQFITEVIRLRTIDAASALETLRPLVSREGAITANKAGRSVVVADYADNIARIREVLARIDHEGMATQMVALQNAGAREIATSLQQLMQGGGEGNAASATVVAIDSSNSIALRGDATSVARLAAMARDLDRRAGAGSEIRVYWLEHADAEKLLPVLQQLLGQSVAIPSSSTDSGLGSSSSSLGSSSTNGQSAPSMSVSTSAPSQQTAQATITTPNGNNGIAKSGSAIVTRYAGTNAIIVAGSTETQRKLGEVIRQLDTRREQILVEAIIVEVGEDAAKKLGVQFLVGSTDTGFAATNYSNASPNILTVAGAIAATQLTTTTTTTTGSTTTTGTVSQLGTTLQDAAVSSLLNATGGLGGVATTIGSNGVLGAIINAVKSDSNSNILSTPSVMTLDNQKASILVGQEVPVTSGQALSQNFDNQFRTVQRQNVGIQLDVRPQVNAAGTIKLFLRQEVSSVAGPVSSRDSDLIINKRQIETTVTVDDGDILALGGLLNDNERRTIEKIPLLGDIPGLGALFRSKTKAHSKTSLMVFIRPTILRSREDAQAVTAQRYGYIRGKEQAFSPDREPALDELVRDYMGTTAPVSPKPDDQVIDGRLAPVSENQSQSVVRPVETPPAKAPRK
ncbi:MAG TPA: type II secretion system secretin GspD [Sphingobium sp.]|uniref:type II secretion system secretin GspD n=1 Tax=Sphingobium sp. TaxID=1912891 RepID=UPI002ED17206